MLTQFSSRITTWNLQFGGIIWSHSPGHRKKSLKFGHELVSPLVTGGLNQKGTSPFKDSDFHQSWISMMTLIRLVLWYDGMTLICGLVLWSWKNVLIFVSHLFTISATIFRRKRSIQVTHLFNSFCQVPNKPGAEHDPRFRWGSW